MFGIDLIDAGLLPAMVVALVAGVLSFLSPCVLPIVPPYLAYMGGISIASAAGPRPRQRSCRCRPSSSCWACPRSSCSSASRPRPLGGSSCELQTGSTIARRDRGDDLRRAFPRRLPDPLPGPRAAAWTRATAADRPLGPMSWAWPSPSAGRPASGRSWARSCRWPPPRPAWRGARAAGVYAIGLGIPSCWSRPSSRA